MIPLLFRLIQALALSGNISCFFVTVPLEKIIWLKKTLFGRALPRQL